MPHKDTDIRPGAIRAALEDRGVGTTELARRTGYSTRAVASWKSGERHPTYDALIALARAVDLEPGELFQRIVDHSEA